jgi:CRISPR-associated protein Cas2
MILERVPAGVRGELSRWLIEPHTGVFVGHVSARVRDKLWWRMLQAQDMGGIIQIWSTNTEQRYQMRKSGETDRLIIDYEGVQLMRKPAAKTSSVALSTDDGNATIQ